jgi:hypothetical protein
MVPTEFTWIGEWGSSMALSAYSAVILRKMLPVHTKENGWHHVPQLAEHKFNDESRESQAFAETEGDARLDSFRADLMRVSQLLRFADAPVCIIEPPAGFEALSTAITERCAMQRRLVA